MSKILEFSELLVTKFCHDIAGQITAVDNGIEFLKDGQAEIKNKALELISTSSAELIAKLNFFRYAYGTSKHDGEADIEQIYSIIQAYFKYSKIKIVWQQNYNTSLNGLTNRACKLLVNLVIVVSTSLIYGGTIDIKIEKGKYGKIIRIIGKGIDFKINNDAELILIKHEQRVIKIENVQIHLTAKIASEFGTVVQSAYIQDQINYFVELGKIPDNLK